MTEEFRQTSHGEIALRDSRTDGPAIVMLHANSLCKEGFEPQIAALSGKFRTIAIDLPGHGHSSDAVDPRRSYSMSGYADAVSELLTGLGISRYAVLGHSLGGHVALELLAHNGPSISGAVLFGTPPVTNSIEGLMAGFVPGPEVAYTGSLDITDEQVTMIARMALGKQDEAHRFFLDAIRRTDGRARQYMMEDAQAGNTSDQRRVAETSSTPLMIINGADDPVINLDYVDSLAYRSLWTPKPIRLAGAGHAPHRERAQDFNALLIDFLEGTIIPV